MRGGAVVALALLVAASGCAVPRVASDPVHWGVPANSGTGRRIVYRKSTQQAWLVEAQGAVTDAFPVSGRLSTPNPGTYHVFHRIDPGRSGRVALPHFVGFAHGRTTDIGFHGIPLEPGGHPIERDDQLGTPLSHGCVRVAQDKAREIWDWSDFGTTVVVVP